MKNQYFADINDYRTYGLLRILAGNGQLKTIVCWMLTPDDGRADGKFTNYLSDPARWRAYDPPLFDALTACMAEPSNRSVLYVQASQIIPGARYFDEVLTDDPEERQGYFARFHELATGCDLAFFDPDNGIQVKSVPYGRKRSSKYVYWGELREAFDAGLSLLVFQYFGRVRRDVFIQQLARSLCEQLHIMEVFCFSTAKVLFLLAPQPRHQAYLSEKYAQINAQWSSQIQASTIDFA